MRTYRTYIILFTCITSTIQKKKTNHLHTSFSHHVHIHRYFWFCEYVYHPSNHLQHHNHKRNHKHQISIYLAKTSSMNPHPKKIRKSYLNNSKDLLKQPLFILYMAIIKAKQNSQKNNIIILNDQEVHLNNIILIGRSDYTNKNRKKTKDQHLTNKTYNIVLDHQPQGTKENIKNNVDLQLSGHTHNRQMFPLSYSYHLQPDFAGNYGKETYKHYTKIISSGLVGWGFPIRTEGICEYVVVNVTPDN